jgi:hypothetical protein
VYISDRVIRPINLIEKQRINAILASFFSPMRKRRDVNETSTEAPKEAKTSTETPKESKTEAPKEPKQSSTPVTSTTEFPMSKELKEFLSNTFNVNANVTERFLPITQMSPFFNHFMRQGEQLFEPRNDDPRGELLKIELVVMGLSSVRQPPPPPLSEFRFVKE